jgi:hypothetical protein
MSVWVNKLKTTFFFFKCSLNFSRNRTRTETKKKTQKKIKGKKQKKKRKNSKMYTQNGKKSRPESREKNEIN